ncbi:phosphodiester glycosidase family protein [Pedobacter sp. ASV1-7]|uniref:phosphodiester glycosidase family protein n=1 Tax=Pedobacter sp. ASV1-7 TaxID=3145237 RepID=UPI0032E8704D
MKNNIVIKMLLLFAVLFVASCSKTKTAEEMPQSAQINTKKPVEKPINNIRVKNYPNAAIKIDDLNKKIFINVDRPIEIKKLHLDFDFASKVGITSIFPSDEPGTYYSLKINNNTHQQVYTITVESKPRDLNGWSEEKSFGDLPSHIKLYKSTFIQGKKGIAYMAIVDLSKNYKFKIIGEATGVKTPSSFYEQLPADQKPALLINSGYFTYSTTQGAYGVSLLIKEGVTVRHNTSSTDRSGKTYYMTRSAIGMERNGPLEINWVYTDGVQAPTYAYPEPAANIEGEAPLPKPSLFFPVEGRNWKAFMACGAGPIAAKDGRVVSFEDMKKELITGDGSVSRPRSAVGLTSDNKMIIYVNQGNGFDGLAGYTWEEVGKELVKLGCYDVIHFDGGGSSCMLINGQPLIKGGEVDSQSNNNPDGAKQRAVATVVTVN